MNISRGKWYRLLALSLLCLMMYDQKLSKDRSNDLRESVQCLIQKKGDSSLCPKILVDPVLEQSVLNMFDTKMNQTKPTISIFYQDEFFEVQLQTSKTSGVVLEINMPSKSNYRVIAWRELNMGGKS